MDETHKTVEHLIESLGNYNWYQILICSTILSSTIPFILDMLMMTFGGYTPNWCLKELCVVWENIGNGSYHTDLEDMKNCSLFNNNNHTAVFDKSISTVVSEWNLICGRSWIIFVIISLQMLGVFVGSILGGYLADRYGRKLTFYGCVLMHAIFNLITIFSNSWPMFAICRIFIGVVVGANVSVGLNYSLEFVGRKARNGIIAFPHWPVGTIVMAFVVWLVPDWKHYHIANIVISIPVALSWFFVPESIRWLTVKGRIKEAHKIVTSLANKANKPVPDINILYAVANEEKRIHFQSSGYSYSDLFRRKEFMKRSVLLLIIWFFISGVYYGLVFSVSNLVGDLIVNLLLMSVAELPKIIITMLLPKIFGRRWSAASLFGLGIVASAGAAISALCASGDSRKYGVLVCFLVTKLSVVTAWGFLSATTAEQFPTVTRNLAFGAGNSSARLGSIFSSIILYYSGNVDYVIYLVSVVLCFICGVCILLLEETKSKPMEDTFLIETSERKIMLDDDSRIVCPNINRNSEDLSKVAMDQQQLMARTSNNMNIG